VSFSKACGHIRNFSSAHESRARLIEGRLDYPDQHIEADNRLSWFLGSLDRCYGDDAWYVRLSRNKEDTAQSFNRRWHLKGTIMHAFVENILLTPLSALRAQKRKQACALYYDTIYDNIDLYLKDKTHVLEVTLEDIKGGFRRFWDWIGAEGDLEAALKEFDTRHNMSRKRFWFN